MVFQVCRGLRRALPREVFGRCPERTWRICELPSHQPGIAEMAKAECQVDGFLDKVGQRVIRNHIEPNAWIFLQEGWNGRDNDPPGEGIRARYA